METLQIRDLRIGNILREKYTGDIITVSELTKDRITFDYKTDKKWQSEPIPLTEEWLLKLGFEKLTDRIKGFTATTYTKKGYYFDDTTNGCWRLTISNINIKNVHQLQNIFYALTGEELKATL